MEFLVLGPLRVMDNGQPVTVAAPRQRALLAALLIHANEVVSTDRLLDLVWGSEESDVGVSTLRYHVSKLRDALEPERESGNEGIIATQSPGYVLHVSPSHVDSLGFEALVAEARQVRATDPALALKLLDEALGLWRGPAYTDFAYEEYARLEVLRLEERRLAAIEDRVDALLALGRDREVVGDLQALVAEHPRRERLAGALMVALYRSGRQSDALAVYQALRRELGEGLGIEPSQELRDLEERMLLQDDALLTEKASPGPDLLRGYVLRGRIGEGAHGVVWRAAQPGLGREVAIKAIRPDLANRAEFVRRFEMEGRLVASLEHPHIVSLYDFWRDPDGAYLVMPYLRGGSLADRLQTKAIEPKEALRLLQDVGAALTYAHRRGVVHRDVTPQNVLLDEDGNSFLADFGVATLLGEVTAKYAEGTPSAAYLSPELFAGRPGTPASDVFSLGMLTMAMLGGSGSLQSDVADAVDRATASAAEDRFASVDEFLSAVAPALGRAGDIFSVGPELRNPYKGLRAFGEADAPDFYGRTRLVTELVDAVGHHRLVGVVGPSGCGKSSLVRAGLIPEIRRGALPGSERWLITDMYPGTRPLAELESALLRVAVDRPDDLGEQLGAGNWAGIVENLLPRNSELLLIVDQFEELFTLTGSEETRRHFLEVLESLTADPRHRVRIIVTMRADYYDRPLEYPEFAELLRQGLVSVSIPSRGAMVEAVVGPARMEGLEIEPGLAEAIVGDVADQPGGLPLLEYALTELFRHRDGSRLTAAGYRLTGGVLGALGARAEELYQEQTTPGQGAIQQMFLRLVNVVEGAEDTRKRIRLTELRQLGIPDDVLGLVLDTFVAHRLLTLDRDPKTREPTVEVAHEALLARWERLRSWIDERRDDLVLHRRLGAAVNEWEDAQNDSTYLLKGGRLEHYEDFSASTDIALTGRERHYLQVSREAEAAATARQRRRRLGVLTTVAGVAVVALVLAVVAFLAQRNAEDAKADALESEQVAIDQRDRADAAADEATTQQALAEANAIKADTERAAAERQATINRAQELAAESRATLETDPELGILLALESVAVEVDGEPLKKALDVLHHAVITSRLRFSSASGWNVTSDGSGERIVTGALGEPVTVYHAETSSVLATLPVVGDGEESAAELAMAMSPDGQFIATGRSDGTIALWDVASSEEVFTTNDRQSVWTDSSGGTFTLSFFDATTAPLDFDSEEAEIEQAIESLAGVSDVVVSGVGSAESPWLVDFVRWDDPFLPRLGADGQGLTQGSNLEVSGRGHDVAGPSGWNQDAVTDVAFSPNGAEFASRGHDDTVRIWDVASGEERLRFSAPLQPDEVRDVVYSHDGSLLATVGETYVDVHQVATGALIGALEPERDPPLDVAFLPSGTELVISYWGQAESSLTVWDLEANQESTFGGSGSLLRSVAVNEDGTLLASGDDTGTIFVKRLSPTGSADWVAFAAHPGDRIWDLAFSGQSTLLSASDTTMRMWDLGLAGNREWITRETTPWGFDIVDYSPDGALIAYANQDGRAVVIDAQTGETAHVLQPDPASADEEVYLVAFSPAGVHLATSTVNSEGVGAVRLWDARSGELTWKHSLENGILWALEYSSDGSMLGGLVQVGESPRHEVRLWDAISKEERVVLQGDYQEEDMPRGFAISPDGREFAIRATTIDGAPVVFYDLSGEEIRRCCEHPQSVPWYALFEYSPDGRLLMTTGVDPATGEGEVKVWDLATSDLLATLEGHRDAVRFAIFSPDGSQIASSGASELVLWDFETQEPVTNLLQEGASGMGLSFSPDGKHLASVGDSPALLRVWVVDEGQLIELAQSRVTRTFTATECEIYKIDCPVEE